MSNKLIYPILLALSIALGSSYASARFHLSHFGSHRIYLPHFSHHIHFPHMSATHRTAIVGHLKSAYQSYKAHQANSTGGSGHSMHGLLVIGKKLLNWWHSTNKKEQKDIDWVSNCRRLKRKIRYGKERLSKIINDNKGEIQRIYDREGVTQGQVNYLFDIYKVNSKMACNTIDAIRNGDSEASEYCSDVKMKLKQQKNDQDLQIARQVVRKFPKLPYLLRKTPPRRILQSVLYACKYPKFIPQAPANDQNNTNQNTVSQNDGPNNR